MIRMLPILCCLTALIAPNPVTAQVRDGQLPVVSEDELDEIAIEGAPFNRSNGQAESSGSLGPISSVATTGGEIETARRYDATSASGVSYSSGAFTFNTTLLSIGNGEFPHKLDYSLMYSSGSNRSPNVAWLNNWARRRSLAIVDDPCADVDCSKADADQARTWQHNLVIGHRSVAFHKQGPPHNSSYSFMPITLEGNTAVFTRTSSTSMAGYYTLTLSQGEVVYVGGQPADASLWNYPDGTTISSTEVSGGRLIHNNFGLALLFPPFSGTVTISQTICAINLTQHAIADIQGCPTGAPKAVVTSQDGMVTGILFPNGKTQNFQYATSSEGGRTRKRLNCVTEPGNTACLVTNIYDSCDGPHGPVNGDVEHPNYDAGWNGSRDRVVRQNFADGRSVTYAYPVRSYDCRGGEVVTVNDPGGGQQVVSTNFGAGTVASVRDELGKLWSYGYTGGNGYLLADVNGNSVLSSQQLPEGNSLSFTYDDRGNKTETKLLPKSGSGASQIVSTATFPPTCANPKTCNKPTSVTDARGGVTTYTYDPAHGGVLTEVGPAVGGVSPAKRHYYVQRNAWLKNASGYTAAAAVWVKTEERSCRTSALNTSAGSCTAGSADLVRTLYEYGPNSGPNNLWLRGVAVVANGQTLRTCYGYDEWGNKISETEPKAGLSSCS